MNARQKTWLLAIVAGNVAFLTLAVVACIPEYQLVGRIKVEGEDHLLLSVPTTGKLSHFKRSAPRYVEIWAGRVDRPKLEKWVAEFERPQSLAADPWPVTEPWPDGVEDNLPVELRSEPFITEGDRVRYAVFSNERWRYDLKLNDATGGFTLLRTIVDDP
jgi:hypothetical protein